MNEAVQALFIGIATVAFAAIVTALPVMLLWNYVVPDVFGLPEIGFFKALGMAFLTGILFKSSK